MNIRSHKIFRIIFNTILSICVITIARYSFCLVIDKIVVVVNDEVITQREVAQHLIPIYERYKKEYTGKKLESKMMEAEDIILDQLIDDKLILSEAKKQGIEAQDKEIELKLQTIKNRFETDGQFRDTLAEQNISLSELRDRVKNDIIQSHLVHKEMGSKIVITPSEVRQYYDNHIEDFTEQEKARVLSILIKKEQMNRTKDEARFLIEKIKELIENGEDFEKLAKEYSEGLNVNARESFGLVEKGEMIEEIDEMIFSLKIGEISDIVESPVGYHLFKVIEKIPAKMTDFEVAKYEIEELIYRERIDKKLKKWLKELRENAYISIK